MTTINNIISIINKEIDVFNFVSIFLGIQPGLKISRSDIIRGINFYIDENRDVLKKHPIQRGSFRVMNELKDFFKDLSLIDDLRTTVEDKEFASKKGYPPREKMIVPEIMKHSDIMKYLKFCERKYSAPNIPTEKDLVNQRRFINSISSELFMKTLRFRE